jgi:hypothetical protein
MMVFDSVNMRKLKKAKNKNTYHLYLFPPERRGKLTGNMAKNVEGTQ